MLTTSLLRIDASHTTILYPTPHGGIDRYTLAVGDETLVSQHRWHSPPLAQEVEHAIITLEDALAVLPKAPDHAHQLRVGGENLNAMVAHFAHEASWPSGLIARDTVEGWFTRFSNVVMGHPARVEGLPEDALFAANLLMLREVMHHLGFEQLQAPSPPPTSP